jgi:hypothetical protein
VAEDEPVYEVALVFLDGDARMVRATSDQFDRWVATGIIRAEAKGERVIPLTAIKIMELQLG